MSHSAQAALRGEPSYVWRAGQDRRLKMIVAAASAGTARVLENGCGLGTYIPRLRAALGTPLVHGLEYEFDRAAEAGRQYPPSLVLCAAGERLPYADDSFDLILSNEVLEHVQDDRQALAEMARAVRPGGRIVIFCPNRWYPVETHGVYWRGRYVFGNIPLVNYLPDPLRNRLAPHVRAYTGRGLRRLLAGLPLRVVRHTRIFGGYDNLIARLGPPGRLIRAALHAAEASPLNVLGLSHFLVLEKTPALERRGWIGEYHAQGMEEGAWQIFQDQAHAGGPDHDWRFEGLYRLQAGDELTVYAPDGSVLWSGVLRARRSWFGSAGGWELGEVSQADWDGWFRRRPPLEARLRRAGRLQ